tara:strand:- start:437 stop:592 length:156 start_codon:yes stop_codon:yes gene_type:complete
MKIEFTRAEIERILLDHANKLVPYANFDSVKGNSYRDLPDAIIVEKKDAAQ